MVLIYSMVNLTRCYEGSQMSSRWKKFSNDMSLFSINAY